MMSKTPVLLIIIGVVAFFSVSCKPQAMVKNLLMSKAEKEEANKPKSGIFRLKKGTLPTGVTRHPPKADSSAAAIAVASVKP